MKLEILDQQHQASTKGSIVFIHGACMGAWVWKDNFLPYFFYKGYNTFAVSLRNHGASENNGKLRWTSIKEYVEDLTQVIDSIDGPIYLVGHSMGGFTIQHYMQKPSSKVKAAALLCSVPNTGLWKLVVRLLVDFPLKFLMANMSLSWLPIVKDKKELKKLMFSKDYPIENMDSILKNLQDESFLAFLEMVFLRLPRKFQLKTPLMVVGAEKDYLVSETDTRKMGKHYNVEPIIIPNASHCFMLEEGWVFTAEKINQFFALH
jgi:pimeloyl-ACP methyl ester carboxylesterase